MDTNYGMEIVRATEISALTAARLQGLGDYREILNHARSAISKTLNRLKIDGVIVNDRFRNRPGLFAIPERLGQGGPTMDLMAIALEAHHSAASGGNNGTSYAVIAPANVIQSVPNLKMFKIVVGPHVGNVIDIHESAVTNVKRTARALKKYTENVTVCILNHVRHEQLIQEVRECGARIKLIEEGELSGCLSAITGEKSDIYIGYGYAPEGALAAAAISCLGGYMEGKICYENDSDRQLAAEHGITDVEKIFRVSDLVRSKELAIAATGVTDGEFLEGVRFTSNGAVTSSFVARAETKTYRKLVTHHFFDHKPIF